MQTGYENVKARKILKLNRLVKKYESRVRHIPATQLFVLHIVFTLLVSLFPISALAQISNADAKTEPLESSSGTIIDRDETTATMRVDRSRTSMIFTAPKAANSTVLNPINDGKAMSLLSKMDVGSHVTVYWRPQRGLRVPVGFDLVLPEAAADMAAQPIIADASLVPRELLTERGGYFDLLERQGEQLLIYDRLANTVSGDRDIYRMYADGRLPFCLTCFISPRPRARLGNPAWHPNGAYVIFQQANDNATSDPTNGLDWGINNDLWSLRLEDKSLSRIVSSEPGHGAAYPNFRGNQIIYAERSPPDAGTSGRRTLIASLAGDDPWDGWQLRTVNFNHDKPIAVRNNNSEAARRRIIPYFNSGQILEASAAEHEDVIDGIFTRGAGRTIRNELVLRNPPGATGNTTYGQAIGPALHDRQQRLTVYTSSRAIADRQVSSRPENTPTDLFVRVGNSGKTYQLTTNGLRSRQSGDTYQVIDLGWTNDRQWLFAAIGAKNSITGRERETEIWRFDISALRQMQAASQQPVQPAN